MAALAAASGRRSRTPALRRARPPHHVVYQYMGSRWITQAHACPWTAHFHTSSVWCLSVKRFFSTVKNAVGPASQPPS